jgi:putative glutamine amidotransferase
VLAADPETVHSGVYLEKTAPYDPDLAGPFHRIFLLPDSAFVKRMGIAADATPQAATSHHQAIDKLAAGLRAAALSLDGRVVEAVEHLRFANVLGVQFHPERRSLYQKGLRQRRAPGAALDFNPLAFLKANPPSYEFHRAIWKWFAEQVAAQE